MTVRLDVIVERFVIVACVVKTVRTYCNCPYNCCNHTVHCSSGFIAVVVFVVVIIVLRF